MNREGGLARGASARLASLPGPAAADHGGAVSADSRSVVILDLLGQAVGVALGCGEPSSVDQIADRRMNVVEVMQQQTREGHRVELTRRVRRVDDLVLELSGLHPHDGKCRVGGAGLHGSD